MWTRADVGVADTLSASKPFAGIAFRPEVYPVPISCELGHRGCRAGIAGGLTALAFPLIGDAVRDILDPEMSGLEIISIDHPEHNHDRDEPPRRSSKPPP